MAKPARPPAKPRRKRVANEVVAKSKATKTKPIAPVQDDTWQEKRPRKTRKTNRFCVDCLDLETCVKEKLAAIAHCMDRRV